MLKELMHSPLNIFCILEPASLMHLIAPIFCSGAENAFFGAIWDSLNIW